MALFKSTKVMLAGQPIDIYNNGQLSRDFTNIYDINEGILRIADVIPVANLDWQSDKGSPADSSAPYRIFNIGK